MTFGDTTSCPTFDVLSRAREQAAQQKQQIADEVLAARKQAQELGRAHLTNGFSAEDHLQAAAEAERQRNFEQAARF